VADNLIHFEWALKKILREKINYNILEGFLSELFKSDITILQIDNNEKIHEKVQRKFNCINLLAKSFKDGIILVELQVDSELDYYHKLLYGVRKSFSEQFKLSETFSKIEKVYSINIFNFKFGEGSDYLYHGKTAYRGVYSNDALVVNRCLLKKYKAPTVFKIVPEYYIIRLDQFNNIVQNELDEWIYLFKNIKIESHFNAKGLDLVKQKLKLDQLSATERISYNSYWENRRFQANVFETASFEFGIKTRIANKTPGKIEIFKDLVRIGMKDENIVSAIGVSLDEVGLLKSHFI
jgi:predicted transposase/invertase (TIGR01784 family)